MKQKRAQKDSTRPFEKVPIYQLAREVLRESHVIAARMSQGYKYSLESRPVFSPAQDYHPPC